MNQNINDDIIINMYVTDKKRINSNLVRHIDDAKYKLYKEYLLNRYDDIDLNNFTYKEIIWRIYLGQEKRNRCPICNNYTPYNYSKLILKEQSVYRKYCCSSCAAKSNERNIKYKETNISKYGVPYVLLTKEVHSRAILNAQSDEAKEKRKRTCIEKYGVSTNLNIKEIREKSIKSLRDVKTIEKRKRTCIKKYGCSNPINNEQVKEKSKQTCLKRFGVDNYFKTRKNIEYTHSEPIIAKINETKRKNHTFNISKQEDKCYNILINKYNKEDVLRQYKSDVYPFQCDFYIKSINTYIECNFHWTHGCHLFDSNNKDDINKLEQLNEKAKTSKFYKNAIKVWTERDVNKHNVAKKNNLNYLTFYNEKDFIDYFYET